MAMSHLPVMLKVAGRPVLVVGGGAVARRRAASLIEAGAVVTVVAPRVDPAIEAGGAIVKRRRYEPADIDGVLAVVIATDDPAINERVGLDAARCGVLVNRADDAQAGDLVIPAHRRHGPVTLAASTDGISAGAGRRIIEQLDAAYDEDWTGLLETARAYRAIVQQRTDRGVARRRALRRLTDARAMAAYKAGGADAARRYLEQVIADAT
jgi:siroheme synthase-like protein